MLKSSNFSWIHIIIINSGQGHLKKEGEMMDGSILIARNGVWTSDWE
jgi:hypothetical protein